MNEISKYLLHVVNTVAMTKEYVSWSDKFARSETTEALDYLREKYKGFDFGSLSKKELSEFGFGNWDAELMLIPLYLLPCIKEGTELYSISDERIIVGKDVLDNDVRFGCVAYGFKIKE
jgi:hypothetical protein